MELTFKTKSHNKEQHDYSLIARLTEKDFNNSIIREIVLRISIPIDLNWGVSKNNKQVKQKRETVDGKERNTFEIRFKETLYPQDMPFEILGPRSDIGELLYTVQDENHYIYLKDSLFWALYGEGVSADSGERKLAELQRF